MLLAREWAWKLPSSKLGWRWPRNGSVPTSRWQCSQTAAALLLSHTHSQGGPELGCSCGACFLSILCIYTHTRSFCPPPRMPGAGESVPRPTWVQLPVARTEALHTLSLRQPSPAAGQPHPWGCYEQGRALQGSCSTPRGLPLPCSHLSVLSRQAQACWSHPEPQELSVCRGESGIFTAIPCMGLPAHPRASHLT